jgi:AraC-like DNA-binding protein
MQDRLAALLNRFELRARVFQTGALCEAVRFDAAQGLGHIHVLRRGVLKVVTAGARPRTLAEPSLIFYTRPVTHRLLPHGPEGVDLVCATVEFGALMHNPLTQAVPPMVVLPLSQQGTLSDALNLLFREAAAIHCGRQAVLDRLSEVVIVLLLRHLMDQNLVSSGLLAGLAEPRLAKAINAMHAHPARPWTLDDLAREAGMSRARFALRFRSTVGQTSGKYLSDWRISLAQSLLRKGKPVKVVASEVGYESASALARAFTARVRISPTTWARREASGPEGDGGRAMRAGRAGAEGSRREASARPPARTARRR